MEVKRSLFLKRNILIALLISASYLVLSSILIGFKIDQLVITLLFNLCYFLTQTTRRFIIGFSIFIIFWIIFDFMKGFPNYEFTEVNIKNLYLLEKRFFGIDVAGEIVTLNEYYYANRSVVLSFLTGAFYLSWVPVPIGFACYLFFKDKERFLHFSMSFLLVNLLGFILYYLLPAAPPWYVIENGYGFIKGTPGSMAGLKDFDALVDYPIFQNMYEKSSNVFAAFPSLHSAYPIIVLYHGIKNKLGKFNIVFGVLVIGIWFAAVYNYHHYVVDVIGGIIVSLLTFWLFDKVLLKTNWFKTFVDKYKTIISKQE